MLNERDKRKIELLEILSEGCRKHPAYRARRKVRISCEDCVQLWNARVELTLLNEARAVLVRAQKPVSCGCCFRCRRRLNAMVSWLNITLSWGKYVLPRNAPNAL